MEDALKDIAAAIRELACAIRSMGGNEPETPPDFVCANSECRSTRWRPGGMGEMFKQCVDCGTIGGAIDEA